MSAADPARSGSADNNGRRGEKQRGRRLGRTGSLLAEPDHLGRLLDEPVHLGRSLAELSHLGRPLAEADHLGRPLAELRAARRRADSATSLLFLIEPRGLANMVLCQKWTALFVEEDQ